MSLPTESKMARKFFGISLAAFAVYLANVVMGGPLKRPPFLSDIQEMLALLVSVGSFVFGTLAQEAAADPKVDEPHP